MVKRKTKSVKIADAPPEKMFWVNNGPVVKNVKELLEAVKSMNKETFMHHVNREKNDFSKWIKGVLNDNKLAKSLERAKTKEGCIRTLQKAV